MFVCSFWDDDVKNPAVQTNTQDDGSGKTRKEQKKATNHLKTKPQKIMLSKQLVEGGIKYAEQVMVELVPDEITTVTKVKFEGRRRQDAINLQKRILGEDEKASCLTRTKLTIEGVQVLALATKLTNDATFTFDATVLLWHEKVEKMSTATFWVY